MKMTSRPPLPQRVSQRPVTDGIHLAEHVLHKYRVVAERLREHLEGPERDSLDLEMVLTHCEVTDAIRQIGKVTYEERNEDGDSR